LILRALAWSIEPFGLVGRSYWGRRTRIAWTDVSRVALLPGDIPGLVVMSASSKNEIVAYLLGVDSTEVYAHVSRYAGHTHVFAQWFKQRSA
jgi:hypothetical protein